MVATLLLAQHRRRRRCCGAGRANRRPDPVGSGCGSLFRRPQGWSDDSRTFQDFLRLAQHGRCAGRGRAPEFGSSPSADRYRAAAAQPAHSQRLQSPALRRRPDRGRGHAQAGPAYATAADRRQGPCSPHAAGPVPAHSRARRRGRAGGGERRPHPVASGAEVYFSELKDGAVLPPKATINFGLRNMGVAPAQVRSRELRSSSFADRHPAAATRSTDPERLQPSPLRRRPDRGRGHPRSQGSIRFSCSWETRTTSPTPRR